ncbi:hypothetical protein BGX33_010700 [Mortierella sp. NVP41]|nr:hypothetical protein BGX33_010700 [Mortierella sp. NVP41]
MSFFKKDYSAYPQPVIVTPDPRDSPESISAAVAEAIDTTHAGHINPPRTGTSSAAAEAARVATTATTTTASRVATTATTTTASDPAIQDARDLQPVIQQDGSSQQTGGPDSQQQKDTTTRLADGIMSLLGPIVQEMDFNIVSARKSQTELEKEIERLMADSLAIDASERVELLDNIQNSWVSLVPKADACIHRLIRGYEKDIELSRLWTDD